MRNIPNGLSAREIAMADQILAFDAEITLARVRNDSDSIRRLGRRLFWYRQTPGFDVVVEMLDLA